LELDVFPRELANWPKVPQATWIALGTEGTSGNHVCLGEFGPICPKQHISFVNLGPVAMGKHGFKGMWGYCFGKHRFPWELVSICFKQPYFLGKLGHIFLEESCFSAHLSHEMHVLNWELGPTILS